MKFFRLKRTYEPNVIGLNDAESQVELLRDKFKNKNNFDLFEETYFVTKDKKLPKPGFSELEFVIEQGHLVKGAKLTEIMYYHPYIMDGGRVLVSTQFLDILKPFNLAPFRLYKLPIFNNRDQLISNDYQIFHMTEFQFDYIDYVKSTYYFGSKALKQWEPKNFESEDSAKEFLKSYTTVKAGFHILCLNEKFDLKLDMFTLRAGNFDFIISERLKIALENSDLTGLDISECKNPEIITINSL